MTCAEVVLLILDKHPSASFIVQGASSMDFDSGKQEDLFNTQRFRIYSRMAYSLFSGERFYRG
jgi:hypothetical protein